MNINDLFQIDEDGNYRFAPKVKQEEKEYGPKKPMKPKKVRGHLSSVITGIIVSLLFAAIYFFFKLPAINFKAPEFYIFIIHTCGVFIATVLLLEGVTASSFKGYAEHARKKTAVPFYIIALCLVVIVIGSISGFKIIRARDYSKLIKVDTGDFAKEVSEITFSNIPMLDKSSANVLANRKLGELSDLVSQFEVYRDSYQINYSGKPVRVTYLEYGDFFKWLNNRRQGIPAYLIIDMVTQEVSVKRTEQGMRYSPSEFFFRKINRYLRFKYPTLIFHAVNFEIDDEGNPYWLATVIDKRVGLFDGEDAKGAVLVNAITGESRYYDIKDVPTWVDRVYTAQLVLNQYNYYGRLHNGFINSIFGQKDCTVTTDGYNYIAQDDDVWIYTGITSVSGDQGNIGFILVNQRTKEARYYSCAGAEENSAISSAQGAVQQFKYNATFPLLLNIQGKPTYFMALKDASQLVKMYAMVNVEQYQIVAIGSSVTECAANYEKLLLSNGIIKHTTEAAETSEVSGTITDIRSAVIEGTTHVFLRLEGSDVYYKVSASAFPAAILLNNGDNVKIKFAEDKNAITTATQIEKLG